MCPSLVGIRSVTSEIRSRRKKKEERKTERKKKPQRLSTGPSALLIIIVIIRTGGLCAVVDRADGQSDDVVSGRYRHSQPRPQLRPPTARLRAEML